MARALIACGLLLTVSCGTPTPRSRGVELVPAPATGDLATLVHGELERAHRDGRELLVYVGASWCEPCRRFHQAAAEHQLDGALPNLRLLEFDEDRDEPRLNAAGYGSRYIPLFARPDGDGRGSGRQIEGSVKGDGAVGEIVPRLRALLTP
jgi:thiol-disulfide isomerase/thioredoxin